MTGIPCYVGPLEEMSLLIGRDFTLYLLLYRKTSIDRTEYSLIVFILCMIQKLFVEKKWIPPGLSIEVLRYVTLLNRLGTKENILFSLIRSVV